MARRNCANGAANENAKKDGEENNNKRDKERRRRKKSQREKCVLNDIFFLLKCE